MLVDYGDKKFYFFKARNFFVARICLFGHKKSAYPAPINYYIYIYYHYGIMNWCGVAYLDKIGMVCLAIDLPAFRSRLGGRRMGAFD